MKVFLDVGANKGQSLQAALDSDFAFDRIVCFEPVQQCLEALKCLADDRVEILNFGLWNQTCEHAVFQPGSKGAGLWKKDNGYTDETQDCRFVRASDWFRENISATDRVYLKMNCEGAECDILDDLLDSGEFDKVSFSMISFDVRKIAKMKHREAQVMERLEAYPFPRVANSQQFMSGKTHQDRIRNWLRAAH